MASTMVCASGEKIARGQNVFITLIANKQTFEGSFFCEYSARSSIEFRNVKSVPSDGRCFQQLELSKKDIMEICRLPEDNESMGCTEDQDTSDNLNQVSLPAKKFCSFFTEKYFDKLKLHVKEHVYLDKNDQAFSDALKALQEVSIIALSAEGSNEGRFARLGILGLATFKCVYLLDMINIGDRSFTARGSTLKKILESKDVLKVVHNCRLLSDNLFHKYNVQLTNVFDTQVCYSVTMKNRFGTYPSTAVSFSFLLTEFLNFPAGFCDESVHDSNVWRRRPLESGLAEAAALKLVLLLPLRRSLENAFYTPFDDMCKLFLSVVRDSDELEARSSLEKNIRLPRAISSGPVED